MSKHSVPMAQAPGKVFLLLLLLGLAVYALTLSTPFKTMDDYVSIVKNQDIRSLSGLKNIFTKCFFDAKTYYRPLVSVSFMAEYHLFGLKPIFYNINNLLLHVLCAFALYVIIRRMGWDAKLALAVAALFVIHPIHAEAVANIPGRSILLCAFFFFFGFLLFLFSRANAKYKGAYAVGAWVCFTASLLSKESGVMFPFILASYLFFVEKKTPRHSLAAPVLFPYYLFIGLYIFVRQQLGITSSFQWYPWQENILAVLTFLKEVLVYLGHLIYPVGLYYDRSARVFENFGDICAVATIIFWGAALAARAMSPTVKRDFSDGKTNFLASWFVLNFLPVSQLVPIRVSRYFISAADHFMYLPSPAAFIVLVLLYRWVARTLSQKLSVRPAIVRLLGPGFYLFIFLMALQQNFYNRQQIAMYKESLKHNPDNNRVRSTLATAYGISNLPEEAEDEFRKLVAAEPWNAKYRIGLATALAAQEKIWESFEQYSMIVDPGDQRVLYQDNLKILCGKIIAYYQGREEAEKDNPQLFYSLGVMHFMIEEREEAAAAFQKAIALDPNYKEALHNLAVIYDMQGQPVLAADHFRRSLAAGADEVLDNAARDRLKFFEEKL